MFDIQYGAEVHVYIVVLSILFDESWFSKSKDQQFDCD